MWVINEIFEKNQVLDSLHVITIYYLWSVEGEKATSDFLVWIDFI